MKKFAIVFFLIACTANVSFSHEVIYDGLSKPESVAEGPDGFIYVSEIGETDKDGDGKISRIDKSVKIFKYTPKKIIEITVATSGPNPLATGYTVVNFPV